MLSKKKAVLLTLMILHAKCSRVIDKHHHALYVSDYCPRIGACTEGSHVMCTHYNPNKKMGPLCTEYKNITMTEEYAEFLLDILNGIRSRIARGLEKGSNGRPLPRGYGIFRLQWDPELATFAQLWANQCIIDSDICRATKKFADPSQLLVLTLFTDPEWWLLSRRDYFKTPGYNVEKIKYSLLSSVNSWYKTKKWVDRDAILGLKWTGSLLNNQYLQMVQGSATHVGCGVSAFKSFLYLQNTKDLLFNMVRVVCNFSTRIREGDIYTTEPPTAAGYTVKCGCPLGYDEDSDCLCYESGRRLPYSCRYGQCKPHVVVLPIFTVENAPPHKLIEKPREQESRTKLIKRDEIDHYNDLLLRRRIKPSLFTNSSIFILPTRKLKEASAKINVENENTRQEQSESLWEFNNSKRNFGTKKDLNNYQDRNNKNTTIIRETVKKLNISDKKPARNHVMDILNKLELVAKHVHLDETRKDILEEKIQNIYKIFIAKSTATNETEATHKGFNFDYEPDKLYQFEDQVKRIRKYDNIMDNDGKNTYRLNNRNFVDIKNTYDLKDRIKFKDTDSIDSDVRDEDLLSLDKRTYYQRKLNNLERKIHHLRRINRRSDVS